MQGITGFSKLDKNKKLDWVIKQYFHSDPEIKPIFSTFWHSDEALQNIFDEFSENTLSNFYLPFGVAPNFVINGRHYCIPMAIEESSVVAAVSKAAKFWKGRGGFKTKVIDTQKVGQVHFYWNGLSEKLKAYFPQLKEKMIDVAAPYVRNMEQRGGGVKKIELIDLNHLDNGYYQIKVSFDTCDAMGANFINTALECYAKVLESELKNSEFFIGHEKQVNIVMSILSNYTPDCLVRAEVSCPIEELAHPEANLDGKAFAQKFAKAIKIAHLDPHRATTHNKGIFNGIDAVVLSTGNDFRAIEACGHTYAARSGQYKSLTDVIIDEEKFVFYIEVPLAVGTVGGLTSLHPLAKLSLKMLGNPNAKDLMQVMASVGLAQNFAAIRSLITTGIQKGHMKMHLLNILRNLGATETEVKRAKGYFDDKVVSYQEVRSFLNTLRGGVD